MCNQGKENCEEECLAEYAALRDSIVQCENCISNETIYMYVTYFALIALGFSYSWLFLLSYFVLIVFQTRINEDRLAVEKTSAFIKVFFEDQRHDIHWETLHKDPTGLEFYLNYRKSMGSYIVKAGSSLLAGVSVIAQIINLINADYDRLAITIAAIQLALGFGLFVIVIYINSRLYTDKKKAIAKQIKDNIADFYDKSQQKKAKEREVVENDKES